MKQIDTVEPGGKYIPMRDVDSFPTRQYGEFWLRPGKPLPFGATIVPKGVNFSIFSHYADYCELLLYRKREAEPYAVIPFPEEFKTGNVFTMVVFNLEHEKIEYGFRMDGPHDDRNQNRFDRDKILCDPYAKAMTGREIWGKEPEWNNEYQFRSCIMFDDYDWKDDKALEHPVEELVIYESHVRGLTCHESSGVKHPGTFAAIREKIPYFKDLGINCIELLPVYEFDEFENSRVINGSGDRLMNYWGYSTVGFFAPKTAYAATGKYGMQADELKTLIRELHQNGIEVILDVVFNHTAEGNEQGPHISFRGVDNQTYYMLTPEGYYMNYSGCGNTMNCNNPIVRNMILDCLRYWAAEYHIDGFRFDLAAILGRDQDGNPMSNPPLLETLAFDPILGKCKLIAEAWDAGGLNQVGKFPSWGRWAEWNGKYRDCLRRFIKGDEGMVGKMAQRIQGSPDLYMSCGRKPSTSINFVTCHDGFTMMDLVSYDGKHNDANGEDNNDGSNDNLSWNCGWEGETEDEGIKFLRKKQMKNALSILMVSQGVPMILAGDEFGNTQYGNNNAYCQDNPVSWLDWNMKDQNSDLFNFNKRMIAFRKAHPVLRGDDFPETRGTVGGYPAISWHGVRAWEADFSESSRTLAFMLCGDPVKSKKHNDFIYVAMNMHWDMHSFGLPQLPEGLNWHVFANTAMASPQDVWAPGREKLLENQSEFYVGSRSVVILVAKQKK